jgi:hypothetical protein
VRPEHGVGFAAARSRGRSLQHECDAAAGGHLLVALVVGPMLEDDDPGVLA